MILLQTIHTMIPPFSLIWWISTLASVITMVFALRYLKSQNENVQRKWEIGLFVFIIIHLLVWQGYYLYSGTWTAGESLPLHLCGISRILGAVLLVRFNQYLFEFLLLLGLGGALQAFLTPEIPVHYNQLTHIDYYVTHGLIIFFGLYLFHVKGKRPRKMAWLNAFLLGLLVWLIIAIVNHFTDGNYMYLCTKPIVENPLLIGSWPYYLLCFLGFGFVNIILFHRLFRWNIWNKNTEKI